MYYPRIWTYVCIFLNLAYKIRDSHNLESKIIFIQDLQISSQNYSNMIIWLVLFYQLTLYIKKKTLHQEDANKDDSHVNILWVHMTIISIGRLLFHLSVQIWLSFKKTWYNLRNGLCLHALPTHDNGYVGDLDEEKKRLYWTIGQPKAYKFKS